MSVLCGSTFAAEKKNEKFVAPKQPPGQVCIATIEVVAGGGTAVEGKPAVQCKLSQPFGIAFDAQDNMFVCEESHRLLRVDAKTGVLTIVTPARGLAAPFGDGGPVEFQVSVPLSSLLRLSQIISPCPPLSDGTARRT